ncbi:MAG: hypothetical protein M8866_08255 [marine benthic group bacterium]|jgi:hypothetical protein|nr:hypothetical protein [Candidatus Benthicola marisminoris]
MRKLLLIAPLLLVAVLWLYGCDETPVEPPSAVAAETQEGAAPTFKPGDKPPPLPTPVVLSGWQLASSGFISVAPGETKGVSAFCPEGKAPVSGGFLMSDDANYALTQHSPLVDSSDGPGWRVAVRNTGSGPFQLGAYATCVAATAG